MTTFSTLIRLLLAAPFCWVAAEPTTQLTPPTALQQRLLKDSFVAGHLQSGPDSQGNSYASGSFVDEKSQTLHIVGTTYGKWWTHDGSTDASSGTDDPACFYAVAQLPSGGKASSLDWIHSELLGKASVEEGCRGLMLDMQEKRVFIVGHSDTNGILGEFFDTASIAGEDAKLIGQILDYKFESSTGPTTKKPLKLQGGRVIQQAAVSYPVAIAGLPGSGTIYVASMLSTSSKTNGDWREGEQLDPSEYMKYGSDYTMVVRQYHTSTNHLSNADDGSLLRSVTPGIMAQYSTENEETVHVAALLQLPDRLIVAGHTEGVGFAFSDSHSEVDAGNRDGFVTQLGMNNLEPLSSTPTFRITSGKDDYVTGVCFSEQAPEHVYVTGYSKGHVTNPQQVPDDSSTRGYVIKVKLEDMSSVWVQEFDANPPSGSKFVTKAISCSLSHDGHNLFVVGNVDDGAYMDLDEDRESGFGGKDVWIAQIGAKDGSSTDGKVAFVKQIGSEQDDTVAFRGGVQVDTDGNAVLIGNTRGQMYRSRSSTEDQDYADVFLAMFKKDTGDFMLPIDHENFVSLPPKVSAPARTSGSTGIESDSGNGDWIFMISLIVLVVLAVVGFLLFWNCYHIPKREIATDRSKVLDYLHDFDVEDVELKHSATGGWHCSYVNDLSQGINRQAAEDPYATSYRDTIGHVDDGSAYDPLTSGGGSVAGSRRSRAGSRRSHQRYSDDTEEALSFGTARDSRRERRANGDGSVRSKKSRSRTNYSSNSSMSSGSSNRRINKAKERWENREII